MIGIISRLLIARIDSFIKGFGVLPLLSHSKAILRLRRAQKSLSVLLVRYDVIVIHILIVFTNIYCIELPWILCIVILN